MARCRLRCDSVCVYFFIFYSLQVVWTENDFYLYNTDSTDLKSVHVSLNLQNDEHRIHKRDVLSTVTPASTTTATPTKTSSVLNITTQMPLVNVTHKNLGENGTGIRKNYTITTTMKPPSTTMLTPQLKLNTNNTVRPNVTNDEDVYLQFPGNKTLAEHNITNQRTDTHFYYNSTLKTNIESGKFYWVNMTTNNTKIHELLSNSYRRAATVKLSFEFPFYGHLIRNVTLATGGFIYTGDYMHSWLAATQYIAPLMANFDTSMKNFSYVKYADNGTAFTVEWENVVLQDKPEVGNFTFQATLYKNGDIAFVYKSIPILIENIQDNNHPVKVGLSDAYIIDRTIFSVRRKTIYEYHRINFSQEDIKNWTVVYLEALPTCLGYTTCSDCTTNDVPDLHCTWCPALKKCSNGKDRHKEEWLIKGCDKQQVTVESACSDSIHMKQPIIIPELPEHSKPDLPRAVPIVPAPNSADKMSMSGIMATLIIIVLVVTMGIWIMYAYRNPHTTSGQILIRYRPSQWRWRRGEARYTAATIHM